jgi:hypothetical protein
MAKNAIDFNKHRDQFMINYLVLNINDNLPKIWEVLAPKGKIMTTFLE